MNHNSALAALTPASKAPLSVALAWWSPATTTFSGILPPATSPGLLPPFTFAGCSQPNCAGWASATSKVRRFSQREIPASGNHDERCPLTAASS